MTMKNKTIWCLDSPASSEYAQCWLRSPPLEVGKRPCKSCTLGRRYVTPYPLVLEWEAGSDLIGDFSWPGGGRAVVKDSTLDRIREKVPGLRVGKVEMTQDPKLKRSRGAQKKRIWLPYDGPGLSEMIVEHVVPIHSRTTTRITERCDACGRVARELVGIEVRNSRWDRERMELHPFHMARVDGQGLFLAGANVLRPVFRTDLFNDGIFCTNEVKELLSQMELTNVQFLECGEVVDQ